MKSKNTESLIHEIALPFYFSNSVSKFHLSKLWVVGNKSFFKIQLRAFSQIAFFKTEIMQLRENVSIKRHREREAEPKLRGEQLEYSHLNSCH